MQHKPMLRDVDPTEFLTHLSKAFNVDISITTFANGAGARLSFRGSSFTHDIQLFEPSPEILVGVGEFIRQRQNLELLARQST